MSERVRRPKMEAETTTIFSLNRDIETNRAALAVVDSEEAVTKRIAEPLLQSCPSAFALSVLGRLCWHVLEFLSTSEKIQQRNSLCSAILSPYFLGFSCNTLYALVWSDTFEGWLCTIYAQHVELLTCAFSNV